MLHLPLSRRIGAALAALLVAVSLASCLTVRLVSDYDEVLDKGLQEYREALDTFVTQAAAAKKTYASSVDDYARLAAKADVLVARATMNSSGEFCRMPPDMATRIKATIASLYPNTAINSDIAAILDNQQPDGTPQGCTLLLVSNIQQQLNELMQLHKDLDTAHETFNVDVARSVMAISKQAIDAAWTVETAKKKARG